MKNNIKYWEEYNTIENNIIKLRRIEEYKNIKKYLNIFYNSKVENEN